LIPRWQQRQADCFFDQGFFGISPIVSHCRLLNRLHIGGLAVAGAKAAIDGNLRGAARADGGLLTSWLMRSQ